MELKPIKINLSLFQQIDPEDVNPSTIIELAKQLLSGSYNQSEIYTFLDDCHHSSVAQLFTNESLREDWFHLLVALIRKSDFHLGKMIFQDPKFLT